MPQIVCPCPGTNLQPMPSADCVPKIGRVISVAVQAAGSSFDAGAVTPNPITDITSWQAFIGAGDATQMVVFPRVRNFNIPEGSAETDGGYGDSTSGNAAFVGQAPGVASFYVERMTKEQMAAADAILCQPKVQMYMLVDGGVISYEIGTDNYRGFFLDRNALQNLSESIGPDVINKNPFNWPFVDERWDVNRAVTKVDFSWEDLLP